jgi:hypothetical protein
MFAREIQAVVLSVKKFYSNLRLSTFDSSTYVTGPEQSPVNQEIKAKSAFNLRTT